MEELKSVPNRNSLVGSCVRVCRAGQGSGCRGGDLLSPPRFFGSEIPTSILKPQSLANTVLPGEVATRYTRMQIVLRIAPRIGYQISYNAMKSDPICKDMTLRWIVWKHPLNLHLACLLTTASHGLLERLLHSDPNPLQMGGRVLITDILENFCDDRIQFLDGMIERGAQGPFSTSSTSSNLAVSIRITPGYRLRTSLHTSNPLRPGRFTSRITASGNSRSIRPMAKEPQDSICTRYPC